VEVVLKTPTLLVHVLVHVRRALVHVTGARAVERRRRPMLLRSTFFQSRVALCSRCKWYMSTCTSSYEWITVVALVLVCLFWFWVLACM